MCSRIKLIWNIDDKSIEEVLAVLARMGRLYFILSLLCLLYIYMAVEDDELFEIIYECGILVLFVCYVYILRTVTEGVNPTSTNTTPLFASDPNHPARIPKLKAASFIVILISIAYSVKMVYYFIDEVVYLDLALSLLSIMIQLSTLYVITKLITKIKFAEGLLSAGQSAV